MFIKDYAKKISQCEPVDIHENFQEKKKKRGRDLIFLPISICRVLSLINTPLGINAEVGNEAQQLARSGLKSHVLHLPTVSTS